MFLLLLVLLFYLTCGAPYELIKCYLERKCEKDDYDEEEVDIENNRQQQVQQENQELTSRQKWICVLLAIVGVFLQPFYLLFYILYAIMECYRRLPCWLIYAASY
jgi:hypothetical protein